MMIVEFWCPGNPKTKGSMDHIGGGRMRENVKGSSDWRKLMAERARAAYQTPHRHGPLAMPYALGVQVKALAYLTPPPSVAKRGLLVCDEWLRSKGSGDVDKLARNLLDALVDAGVLVDDAQVISLCIDKAISMERPGIHVRVRGL